MDCVDDVEHIGSVWGACLPVDFWQVIPGRIVRRDHLQHVLHAELVQEGNVDVRHLAQPVSLLVLSQQCLDVVLVDVLLRRQIALSL